MEKRSFAQQIGIALTTFLVIFLMAQETAATCTWSFYNKCEDLGGGWVTAQQENYCSGEKPTGMTTKCCCGPSESTCCAKDRNGQITTDNLTPAECAAITYAETTSVPNSSALANRCFRDGFIDVTPESKSAQAIDSTVVTNETIQSLSFKPQVEIPGFEFGPSGEVAVGEYDSSDKMKSDLLARYLKALYDYGLGIAAILAALILMSGGVLWLTSGGNDSKITQAKELIIGSISGLLVLFFSWMLLNTINPALLQFKTIDTEIAARRSYLNCCDPEAGPTSILVEIKGGKTIAREGDQKGKEVSCKSPGKSCEAGEACLAISGKHDCRVDKICCECINYLGVMQHGIPVSFTCKNDMTVNSCNEWCYEWYTTGQSVKYYWGGSTNYNCGETFYGKGYCESK